jgi:hypothetical protein
LLPHANFGLSPTRSSAARVPSYDSTRFPRGQTGSRENLSLTSIWASVFDFSKPRSRCGLAGRAPRWRPPSHVARRAAFQAGRPHQGHQGRRERGRRMTKALTFTNGERTEHERPGLDEPLRLDLAVKIAFPFGGMTVSGLRREAARGRLVFERIAGKQFVTLQAINEMRAQCRADPKVPASTFANVEAAKLSSSSSTEKTRSALAAAQAIANGLKKPSPPTSPESTSQTGKILTLPR